MFFMLVDFPDPTPACLGTGNRTLLQITYEMAPGARGGPTALEFCIDEVIPAFGDENGNEVFPTTTTASVLVDVDVTDPPFRRGDMNQDGRINLSDMLAIALHLFSGERRDCTKAGDVNNDGSLNIADPIYLGNFLFGGQNSPVEPFQSCGLDPDGGLTCDSFQACN